MADAVHLAGATRVHHTTGAMEALPTDPSTLVICEPWRAWRVIWEAQRLPAAQGMLSAAVCVRVDVCDGYVALPEVRFKRKSQK